MCLFFFPTPLFLFTHLTFFSPLIYYTLIAVFLPGVNLFNLVVMTAEQEEETFDLKSASFDPQTGAKRRAMLDE